MAFKILTVDELELLTEKQRKNYDRELAIYNERVKFVEQIERLENAVITPYEPRLTAIPAVCEVPQNEFVEPEYVIVPNVPIAKPKLKVAAVHFGEPVTAVVPAHTIMKNVPVGRMKKVELDKPVLPIIFKAAAPAKSFIKTEQQRPALPTIVKISIPGNIFNVSEQANPDLPHVVKPQNFTELYFTPAALDSFVIEANNSELAMPAIEVAAFTAPEFVVSILPKLEVEVPEVGTIESSQLESPVLPRVIVSKQLDVSFNYTGEMKAELPEVFCTPVEKVLFDEPNIPNINLPTMPKPEIPTKEFLLSEHTVSELPMVGIPQTSVFIFHEPEHKKPVLQTVVKPEVSSRLLFVAPEREKPVLQTVMKPIAMTKLDSDKLSIDSTPKIEYPSIKVFSVKPFEKVQSKASGLPTLHIENSPGDCTEELQKIRLLLQKEYESVREGFA